jgi:ubiquinone/menaquinone biosynthesis C-methylase UbiE
MWSGYLCESMAQIVGPDGAVVGIDVSTDLIAVCNRQKAFRLDFICDRQRHGIGQPDGVVRCRRVHTGCEYVPDVDRVLAETFRVLKPGGRTIFVATDWDAVGVAFRKPGTYGRGHEIMGSALRSPASPEVDGPQIAECTTSPGRSNRSFQF